MPLPPLARTPHLSRLLGPGEEIIYTGKLHPLHGIAWLLAALGFAALAVWLWIYLLLPAFICLGIYTLPFKHSEIAVTNYRLLLRRGRFHIRLDAIDSDHLDHYQFHQSALSAALHYGVVILNLRSAAGPQRIVLETIWHPMTFLQALTTLNPTFRGGRDQPL